MKFTICIAVGALLMSCQTAPMVSADLTAHLPARSADSVMIFKTTEAVPASAAAIRAPAAISPSPAAPSRPRAVALVPASAAAI